MSVTFKDWLKYGANQKEIGKFFYNASNTMKYLHEHEYYIKNFNPDEIEIMNTETMSPIKYNNLDIMYPNEEERLVRSNVYTQALLQIAAYTNTLDSLNPTFVKNNFSEFEMFLPEEDIPYLKGVIERNSLVYYSDYINERNRREIDKLAREASEGGDSYGRTKSKSTAIGRAMVDKETRKLYSNLEERQSAFTTFLILPITMIILGIVMSIMTIFIK